MGEYNLPFLFGMRKYMLQEEEKLLLSLVQTYSPKEVLDALVGAFYAHAGELSDLQIKDRAKELSEVGQLIGEIRDVLEDTGR